MLHVHPLTELQRRAVAFLARVGCATTTEVAQALGLTAGAVHGALRDAEEDGVLKTRVGHHGGWPGSVVRQWALPGMQFADVPGARWLSRPFARSPRKTAA